MRLTLYTDYSLRVLLYLRQKKDAPTTITELAEFYNISRNHLVKVVHNLGLLGFAQTTRGRGGGIWLAPRAEKISVGDIVRKTEPDLDLLECFNPRTDNCVLTKECQLKGVLFNARAAFMRELDRHTLADIGRFPIAIDTPASTKGVTSVPLAKLQRRVHKQKKEKKNS